MDHDHSGAAFIGIFMAVGTAFWVIFSGDGKPKEETPQKFTPLRREKLPRSFETLPTASERFRGSDGPAGRAAPGRQR